MNKVISILVVSCLFVSGCGENPKEIFKACEQGDLAKVQAIVNSKPESMKLLSEVGKMPPIFSAAVGGNPEISEFLISKGAEVNEKGVLGNTPIFLAVHKNDLRMVETFLKHGADLTIKNTMGFTVLHSAVKTNKDLRIIEILIKKGAKVNEKFNGKTPLEIAQKEKNEKVVELLKNNGAK